VNVVVNVDQFYKYKCLKSFSIRFAISHCKNVHYNEAQCGICSSEIWSARL